MSDDVITPGQGGGSASDATRKAVGGWKSMQTGNKESRQQRILRESREQDERKRSGIPEKEGGFKPGDDERSGEFDSRRAKEFMNKKLKNTQQQKTFKGNAQLCMAKLALLFCGEDETMAATNLEIIKVEEAGFGVFKITFTCD